MEDNMLGNPHALFVSAQALGLFNQPATISEAIAAYVYFSLVIWIWFTITNKLFSLP
ncbi:MAG: hypothetical protein UW95_C0007G0007 [Parcubacteria group bacterium GW2011_GWC1_45_14]|nr:MAG: hypothetical protein UW95_C0007G0007 [Parcubacteria group bacterium GW2011_GWC1_45_14]